MSEANRSEIVHDHPRSPTHSRYCHALDVSIRSLLECIPTLARLECGFLCFGLGALQPEDDTERPSLKGPVRFPRTVLGAVTPVALK